MHQLTYPFQNIIAQLSWTKKNVNKRRKGQGKEEKKEGARKRR
jgi:hypothetical protein